MSSKFIHLVACVWIFHCLHITHFAYTYLLPWTSGLFLPFWFLCKMLWAQIYKYLFKSLLSTGLYLKRSDAGSDGNSVYLMFFRNCYIVFLLYSLKQVNTIGRKFCIKISKLLNLCQMLHLPVKQWFFFLTPRE